MHGIIEEPMFSAYLWDYNFCSRLEFDLYINFIYKSLKWLYYVPWLFYE